ncbi:carboxymuconolactone decarboxylase family protein [Aquibacillus saliphilus]|uniref:carboxymuconolactone decarboxylase family protein n=1 Tax=Aquibacillus saliphilus TaxID=1909422 RepID=UPI001CEFDC7D|nr:carboxymuconolactone decarboxylase family protein [Aquibacillus saliphilus]
MTCIKGSNCCCSGTYNGCPYYIDLHVENAKKAGVTKEQLEESIFVAIKGGISNCSSINGLNAYKEV